MVGQAGLDQTFPFRSAVAVLAHPVSCVVSAVTSAKCRGLAARATSAGTQRGPLLLCTQGTSSGSAGVQGSQGEFRRPSVAEKHICLFFAFPCKAEASALSVVQNQNQRQQKR